MRGKFGRDLQHGPDTFVRGTMNLPFKKFSLLAVLALALSFTIAPGSAAAEDSAGVNVYKAKCMTCHAKDGSGDTPVGKSLQSADLRSPEVQKKSDVDLTESISEGKGNMPAFKTLLSADEIHSVLGYVRTLAAKSGPPAKKKSGN